MPVEFVARHQVDHGVGLLLNVRALGDKAAIGAAPDRATGAAVHVALPVHRSPHCQRLPLAGQVPGRGKSQHVQRLNRVDPLFFTVDRMGVGVPGGHVPTRHDFA
ncbi:hypothetical protein D3C75_1091090 [compost metagenome]